MHASFACDKRPRTPLAGRSSIFAVPAPSAGVWHETPHTLLAGHRLDPRSRVECPVQVCPPDRQRSLVHRVPGGEIMSACGRHYCMHNCSHARSDHAAEDAELRELVEHQHLDGTTHLPDERRHLGAASRAPPLVRTCGWNSATHRGRRPLGGPPGSPAARTVVPAHRQRATRPAHP